MTRACLTSQCGCTGTKSGRRLTETPCHTTTACCAIAGWSHVVTDWMGDEGWLMGSDSTIRKFNYLGDLHVMQGKVTGKRAEGGQRLVDLEVWGVNQRGDTTCSMTATVALPSRHTGPVVLPEPPGDLQQKASEFMIAHNRRELDLGRALDRRSRDQAERPLTWTWSTGRQARPSGPKSVAFLAANWALLDSAERHRPDVVSAFRAKAIEAGYLYRVGAAGLRRIWAGAGPYPRSGDTGRIWPGKSPAGDFR